jgi:hypothetical protein
MNSTCLGFKGPNKLHELCISRLQRTKQKKRHAKVGPPALNLNHGMCVQSLFVGVKWLPEQAMEIVSCDGLSTKLLRRTTHTFGMVIRGVFII